MRLSNGNECLLGVPRVGRLLCFICFCQSLGVVVERSSFTLGAVPERHVAMCIKVVFRTYDISTFYVGFCFQRDFTFQ